MTEVENQRLDELERERQACSATTELRGIDFAAQQLHAPIGGASSAFLGRDGPEAEMWEDYATNGAEFSAGDDAEDPHILLEQLRKEADTLGFWNPEAVARALGFGMADVAGKILAQDEEDNFLSEIMRNAGECRVLKNAVTHGWFGHHMTPALPVPVLFAQGRLATPKCTRPASI